MAPTEEQKDQKRLSEAEKLQKGNELKNNYLRSEVQQKRVADDSVRGDCHRKGKPKFKQKQKTRRSIETRRLADHAETSSQFGTAEPSSSNRPEVMPNPVLESAEPNENKPPVQTEAAEAEMAREKPTDSGLSSRDGVTDRHTVQVQIRATSPPFRNGTTEEKSARVQQITEKSTFRIVAEEIPKRDLVQSRSRFEIETDETAREQPLSSGPSLRVEDGHRAQTRSIRSPFEKDAAAEGESAGLQQIRTSEFARSEIRNVQSVRVRFTLTRSTDRTEFRYEQSARMQLIRIRSTIRTEFRCEQSARAQLISNRSTIRTEARREQPAREQLILKRTPFRTEVRMEQPASAQPVQTRSPIRSGDREGQRARVQLMMNRKRLILVEVPDEQLKKPHRGRTDVREQSELQSAMPSRTTDACESRLI